MLALTSARLRVRLLPHALSPTPRLSYIPAPTDSLIGTPRRLAAKNADGPALAHAHARRLKSDRCPSAPTCRASSSLGSGPIVIGQAAEFDYSGTQW
jgi:hypothetical protein